MQFKLNIYDEKDEGRVNLEKNNLEMSHTSSHLIPVFLNFGVIGGTTVHVPGGVPSHGSSDEHFNGLKNSVGVMTSTGI